MKRKSRFLALLLALLLLLTMPCAISEETPSSEEVGTAQDYVDLLMAAQSSEYPETVVFTQAGPFLPAVNVGGARRMRANDAEADENGIKLNKTARDNSDGSYTLTLEAYTTGEVTTVTKSVPVDIVLVLDQSGSMAYNFQGNSTNNDSQRRQYALKQAVNNFIDSVGDKWSAEADHRIAIVTFETNASTLQGWTMVDKAGKTTLQDKINGLDSTPSGATNAGAGMATAESLMGSGYSYNGSNTNRQKVVILFTDGVPTKSDRFDVDTANTAIQAAKNLKDGGATIYSVGIFGGAKVDELYGNCGGEIGDKWGKNGFLWVGDVADVDTPAGNRFLNYVSSNFSNATEIGLESADWWFVVSHKGWEITKNFSRSNTGYYLTANDSASLNEIFQTISQNIQTADIDLGSKTVVKDVVTPYFDLPADASSVKLYTAEAKADGTFASPVPAGADVRAKIQGNTLEVTGFDFNDNYVTAKAKEDGTYGRKLMIEFMITPKVDFIGGNQVPTNDWAQSGVYDEEGNEVKRFADEESTPKVDVPIKPIDVSAQEKNVYLLGSLTDSELMEGVALTLNGKTLEPWQTEFVNVTVAPKAGTNLTSLTEDATYQLTATLAPKDANGAVQAATVESNVAAVKVHTPWLTFKDSAINLGDAADYANNQETQILWKHGSEAPIVPESIYGTEPALTCTFNPAAGAFKQDTPVAVSVFIGDVDVTEHVTFIRRACAEENCGHTDETPFSGATENRVNFVVHVKNFDLTIRVTGWNSIDEKQSFLFTVTGSDGSAITVSVTENGSATLKGLSAGKTYTVTEDSGWSWRYTPASGSQTVAPGDVQNGQAELTFSHTRPNGQWLDGNAVRDNQWSK